uniref:Probable ATP-dependent transporter ycf16 n=1 Tax=Timspurckia oligopyrenoides TaxID=708627 RepID=A0A7S0ZAU5_9RHOD|mmetsp:Transcript_10548/g.19034  ORF Transcript_10548/g.19034 Transcript_10548/m.19034 type:complete len:348 (+) Transcript_10548:38-1081(+)
MNSGDDVFQERGSEGALTVRSDGERPEESSAILVKLENIHKTYLIGGDGIPALRGVSLSIRRGEFVAVYGNSGGGKSSLLHVIGTIDRASKGELMLFGNRISIHTKDAVLADLRLYKIGFVFQSFNLLPSLTARENVELPMLLADSKRHFNAAERKRRSMYLLEKVGMKHRADNYPAQMSGGEQQRVTIARALVNEPQLLLLDEPTGDLDSANTDLVMEYILDIFHSQRLTIVMVTHDLGLRNYADRVVQIRDGVITGDSLIGTEIRDRVRKQLREQTNMHSSNRVSDLRPVDEPREIDEKEFGKSLVVGDFEKIRQATGGSISDDDEARRVRTSVRMPADYAKMWS